MSEQKRKLRVLSGLSAALYWGTGHVLELPDFVSGVLFGLCTVSLVMFLLPDKALDKLKGWKRGG